MLCVTISWYFCWNCCFDRIGFYCTSRKLFISALLNCFCSFLSTATQDNRIFLLKSGHRIPQKNCFKFSIDSFHVKTCDPVDPKMNSFLAHPAKLQFLNAVKFNKKAIYTNINRLNVLFPTSNKICRPNRISYIDVSCAQNHDLL